LKEHGETKLSLPRFAAASNAIELELELERRKHFAEFIVHPILLVSGNDESPDDPPESIAIAVDVDVNPDFYDGIELAQDLLREIVRHQDVVDVMVLLVKRDCCEEESYEDGCPTQLTHGELFDDEDEANHNIAIECMYIDPSWGHQESSRHKLLEKLLEKGHGNFDVSIVLSGCDSEDINDRIWEKSLYESTDSMVSTCTGPQRPQGRPMTTIGVAEQEQRVEWIYTLFTDGYDETNTSKSLYTQIVDYDVQDLNMAVAFHKNMDDGTYKWHLNEANYNLELLQRLKHGYRDELNHLRYFEAADMSRLQFPSKQSANSYCAYLEDNDEMNEDDVYYCDYGYDPYIPNVPIDKVYVGKSGSGENAGRGVFTSVDLLEDNTMIGLETNVQSVVYMPVSKALVDEVADMKIYNSYDDKYAIGQEEGDDDDEDGEDEYFGGDSALLTTGLYRSPSAYAEAYGFDDEPWGIPQTTVYSNIMTFTNHGCNGTANLGHNVPGLNEFTMEPESPGFTIPEDFKQFSTGEYSPHRDRAVLGTITVSQVEHAPIMKGEELFDNYIGFGGDTAFIEQVTELKRDCSGALGTVEMHQLLLQKKKNQKDQHDAQSDPLHNNRRRSKDITKKGNSDEEDDDDGAPKETESKEDPSEEDDDDDDDDDYNDDDDDHEEPSVDGSAGSDEL